MARALPATPSGMAFFSRPGSGIASLLQNSEQATNNFVITHRVQGNNVAEGLIAPRIAGESHMPKRKYLLWILYLVIIAELIILSFHWSVLPWAVDR